MKKLADYFKKTWFILLPLIIVSVLLLVMFILQNQGIILLPIHRIERVIFVIILLIFAVLLTLFYIKSAIYLPKVVLLLGLAIATLLPIAGTLGWGNAYYPVLGLVISVAAGFKLNKQFRIVWFSIVALYLALGITFFDYNEKGILLFHVYLFSISALNIYTTKKDVHILTSVATTIPPALLLVVVGLLSLPNIYYPDNRYNEIKLKTPSGENVLIVQTQVAAFFEDYMYFTVYQEGKMNFYHQVGEHKQEEFVFVRYYSEDFSWTFVSENNYTLHIDAADFVIEVTLR